MHVHRRKKSAVMLCLSPHAADYFSPENQKQCRQKSVLLPFLSKVTLLFSGMYLSPDRIYSYSVSTYFVYESLIHNIPGRVTPKLCKVNLTALFPIGTQYPWSRPSLCSKNQAFQKQNSPKMQNKRSCTKTQFYAD